MLKHQIDSSHGFEQNYETSCAIDCIEFQEEKAMKAITRMRKESNVLLCAEVEFFFSFKSHVWAKMKNGSKIPAKKREMTKKWIETFFSTKNKIGWAKHWVYFVIVNARCLYNNRFSYWKCFSCQKDERRSKKIGEKTKKTDISAMVSDDEQLVRQATCKKESCKEFVYCEAI